MSFYWNHPKGWADSHSDCLHHLPDAGDGTGIAHAAMRAIFDSGYLAAWRGEQAARFCTAGMGETHRSKNLLLQAKCCMGKKRPVEAVRAMYAIRKPYACGDGPHTDDGETQTET